MTLSPNIETFIGCESTFEDAAMVIFGAPFDSTTSYRPGTRYGSSAIRHESFGLETYSPYQDKDLTDYNVFDSGDLELCFGSAESALSDIEARAQIILDNDKFPLLIGGEHLVTLGAFRAALRKHPDLHIIHFDAHTDLRDDYLGAALSHACVIKRCYDEIHSTSSAASTASMATSATTPRIHQFCIRSGERAEFEFAKANTDLHRFNFDGLAETLASIGDAPIYFTIDLDCLDPSCFPGTGTPEAGGVTFTELLNAILLVSSKNVVAADINELSPHLDSSGASTALACKVTRELMLALLK